MSMTFLNSCPNKNSQITGWTTLNASTHGCRTRACSFLPVRYQVWASAARNGTRPDGPAGHGPAGNSAGSEGPESTGPEPTGPEPTGPEPTGPEPTGPELSC